MKLKLSLLGLAVVSAFSAAPALAADTANLNVSANVLGTCRIDAASYNLVLANSGADIDPGLGTNATGTVNVTYHCTNGTASAGITMGNGSNFLGGFRRLASGGNFIEYTLGMANDTLVGGGFGVPGLRTATITGTITPAQYDLAPAGAYSDTVLLSITP